jgi:hypothetical protein
MLQKDVEDYEVAITLAQNGLTKDARSMTKKLKGHFVTWLRRILHIDK